MRMDELAAKLQMALADAQSLAVGRKHQLIALIHLTTALLDQDGGSMRYLLTQAHVNANRLRSALGGALERLPRVSGGAAGEVHVCDDLGRILNVADKLRVCEKFAGRSEGVPGRVRHCAGSRKSGSVAGLRDSMFGFSQRSWARAGVWAVGR